MKKTLLEITIDVLNAIDGDEINSISDTVESLQIAGDIRTVYYDIIGRKDWQFLRALYTLDSVGDLTKPTHLLIPANISKMETLHYNKRKVGDARNYYKQVHFKYPDEFLLHVNGRNNTADNYTSIEDVNGVELIIRTDAHPQYYTSFDDKYIVMDNYDSRVEDTLHSSNTQALLFRHPVWVHEDDFVPEFPAEMFPMFIAECMTFSIAKKDDQLIQKTQQTASRHQRHLSQTHGVVQGGVRYPNYGRTPRKSGSTKRSPLFGEKN